MSLNKQIRTDALDFSDIKENLRDFLRGQAKFSDYDFDGSALSVILDVLAYNTHYNALYTNMAVNESFLDSASKYSSVVSLAKGLGYTSRSIRSARAKLTITITDTSGDLTRTIPRGTLFKTIVGNDTFDFIADSDYTATVNAGVYTFNDVIVVEGTVNTKRITSSQTSRYVIVNRNADVSTLKVKVQDSVGSSVFQSFVYAPNALDVGPNESVYFVKQREDLYYEIYFGDGVIGTAVVPGNVVHMEYMVSSGELANAARVFTYSSGLTASFTGINVTTVLPAAGGASAETLESIKFNAPRAFTAQNRAVTSSDYVAIMNQLFPGVESVTVWGGQENIPKTYGKVFIAAKPSGAEVFSALEKDNMVQILTRKAAVVSVTPVIVDPVYLRIELVANVYYNPRNSRRSVGEISNSVRNNIANFASTLGKFGTEFRFSRLSSQIDSSDDSIVSNITTIRVRRSVNVSINLQSNYTVHFSNPIHRVDSGGTFYSTRFLFEDITDRCYLRDDGSGVVQLFSEDDLGTPTYVRDVGTINYETGSIIVPSMRLRGLVDPRLEYVVITKSNDVIPVRDYIIHLPDNLVTVNMIADQVAAGDDKTSFIFSSSR